MEPPPRVADLCTDVARVRRAEALLVVVPTERIPHRAAEARHVEAVLVLLAVGPAGGDRSCPAVALLASLHRTENGELQALTCNLVNLSAPDNVKLPSSSFNHRHFRHQTRNPQGTTDAKC